MSDSLYAALIISGDITAERAEEEVDPVTVLATEVFPGPPLMETDLLASLLKE